MIIAFYIVGGLDALAFLLTGVMKLVRPKPALKAAGLAWVDDFPDTVVKLIGLAEVLGAVGLILPVLANIAPILSPIAAVCLTIILIGAIVVHVRRKEALRVQIGFFVLTVATAALGFLVVL